MPHRVPGRDRPAPQRPPRPRRPGRPRAARGHPPAPPPPPPLPRSARRVRDALVALGLPADIHRLADSTRTAPEAAAAVGCELGAIVKSLVMRGVNSGAPVLALVSGDNRAD